MQQLDFNETFFSIWIAIGVIALVVAAILVRISARRLKTESLNLSTAPVAAATREVPTAA